MFNLPCNYIHVNVNVKMLCLKWMCTQLSSQFSGNSLKSLQTDNKCNKTSLKIPTVRVEADQLTIYKHSSEKLNLGFSQNHSTQCLGQDLNQEPLVFTPLSHATSYKYLLVCLSTLQSMSLSADGKSSKKNVRVITKIACCLEMRPACGELLDSVVC